tara:strand:- start:87 stop:398 length:312 start_codon:yes stop_codon:yes gene_type:complete
MSVYHNITNQTTKQLIAAGTSKKVKGISIVNVNDSISCTVDLYIEKCGEGKFYLLNKTLLPVGATLIYDDTSFSTSTGQFGLYIKLNKIEVGDDSPAVDVIIN